MVRFVPHVQEVMGSILQGGPQTAEIVNHRLFCLYVEHSENPLVCSKSGLVDLITCIKHDDWCPYDSGSDGGSWGK